MKKKPLFGLVCVGGGAQGAYQVGVLKYIHEHFSQGENSPFQLFSGTSIGSINTTFLASHSYDAKSSRLLLEQLWMDFDIPSWREHLFVTFLKSVGRHWFTPRAKKRITWSLLDPQPLRDIIQKSIFRENIDKAFQRGTTLGISISATEILSGKSCWFQEGKTAAPWNFLRSIGLIRPVQQVHVEASCSGPILFPPVKVEDHYFVDGSLSVKTPLNPIVNMGATRILCIATDKPLPNQLPRYKEGFRPRGMNLFKMFENQLNYNYAVEQAGTLRFINYFAEKQKGHRLGEESEEPRHLFLNETISPENYRTTDVFLFFPSRRIRQNSVYPLGDALGGSRKTRFLFERNFTEQLIQLGYDDARARHEKLKRFFDPAEPSSRLTEFLRRKS